jgi:hypothetical protein
MYYPVNTKPSIVNPRCQSFARIPQRVLTCASAARMRVVVMATKPPCTLTDRDGIFYILRRVVGALTAAGQTDLVDRFLRHAALCQCRRQAHPNVCWPATITREDGARTAVRMVSRLPQGECSPCALTRGVESWSIGMGWRGRC